MVLIDTEGRALGQINGLAVLDVRDHRFGRPTRITSSVSAGTHGVLNIERMASLSGPHHDKGVLILTGFLRETFATGKPLAMTASITLEQSYDEVDGDSATAAEAIALLSALAEIPVNQELAITGSMNQKGRLQAVGGVNEKVEGFFDLCLARGLTGNSGRGHSRGQPPPPHAPSPPGGDGERRGQFHIYAVNRIEEAAELLLETPSGQAGKNGRFPQEVHLRPGTGPARRPLRGGPRLRSLERAGQLARSTPRNRPRRGTPSPRWPGRSASRASRGARGSYFRASWAK